MNYFLPGSNHIILTVLPMPEGVIGIPRTLAHIGAPLSLGDALASWIISPLVTVPLLLIAAIYTWGLMQLWKRAGTGHGVSRWQAASFGAGVLTVALALLSPLGAVSEALFSAHMLQHLLLMMAAVPLIVYGNPALAVLWALPASYRRRAGRLMNGWMLTTAWRAIGHPVIVLMLYIGIVWLLHAPRLYQAAAGSDALHYLQHTLFMLGAGLFWLRVFAWYRGSALKQGMAILYLAAIMIPGMLLGAIIGFAARPIYPVYAQSAAAWGIDALVDQQTGGFMMLMPPTLVYFGVAAALGLKILGRPVRESYRGLNKTAYSRARDGGNFPSD